MMQAAGQLAGGIARDLDNRLAVVRMVRQCLEEKQ
jgi:hypothetical protein